MQIEIKRATETIKRELIRISETKFYFLAIYKNEEPIYGGLYAVSLLSKHYTEVKTKNGLCLDAAIEVYKKTIQTLV